MQPQSLPSRRRNVVTFVLAGLAILVIALIPAVCSRVQRPYEQYATVADARTRSPAPLPRQVPASATQIHERHEAGGERRWLRFTFDPRDVPAMTAGMRLVPQAELERVQVRNPGWSKWWLVSSRTLTGGQGKRIQVYEAPDAYLVVDQRTTTAYYWTR